MADTRQIERCTTAGIDVQMHLQQLAEAVDDERWEAARHRLADVLVDAGAMQSCGIASDRGEVVRHSWEMMPMISGRSSSGDDRASSLNKTAEISLALIDTTPSNLTHLMLEEFGPDSI